jgi:hypothetical protein
MLILGTVVAQWLTTLADTVLQRSSSGFDHDFVTE